MQLCPSAKVAVRVFGVYLHVQRGKGGQVFALTRFNEGCVCFVCVRVCVHAAVCKCLFAFVCVCFCGEYTPKEVDGCMDGWMGGWMDGWKLLVLLFAPLGFLHSPSAMCERVKSELRGLLC